MVFLMETKNKRSTLENLRRSLHFNNSCYVDPEGLSGGLALWWKDEVNIDVRFKSKNILRCVVNWPQIRSSWLITFIYAPPVWNHRLDFWHLLKSIAKDNGYPWVCIGDWNDFGSPLEKFGGNQCSRGRLEQFHSLVSECEFMDLEFKGPCYTWSNNQGGSDNIRIRLDRAMAMVAWRNLFPLSQVFHDIKMGSDHCPLILQCRVPMKKIPYSFKFESKWSTHEECQEVIAGAWDVQQRGSDGYVVTQKLKKCKKALLDWSKCTMGKDKLKLQILEDKLKLLQLEPFSQENFEKEKSLISEIEVLLLREEMQLHQRSRINWLNYGDKNSAFFHASINQRRQRNQVVKLKAGNGEWISDEDGINEHIHGFFSNLFSYSGERDFAEILSVVDHCITDDMNTSLVKEVVDEEIKEAVFQLGSLKAPGPDGYPGFFYQKYWEKVGEDVCKAVKRFFRTGFLLKEWNQTNMVLIPKTLFPESLSQYRPISLCNFTLKVITKIMANRLKGILKRVISFNQSAFVPGRLIQDNIFVAHEAFHFLKMKKKGADGYMALKLDFNKAYDRVEWNFLEALLLKMGFKSQWVQWVMQCTTTVNFAVCVNGETRTKICPERGLRQGDPLSPYLFVLVKDVLSKLLIRAQEENMIQGIQFNRHCPPPSHIFFADDALLFLKAELQNCEAVKSIIEKYGEASGQRLNLDKSGIFFSSNLMEGEKILLCEFLDIPMLMLDSKYLGLPSFWGKSKSDAYSFLIEKALNKMQGWKSKLLNQAGKEIMIKTVIQAIPCFAMSCFLLPKKLCDKINSFVSNFWWKGDPDSKGIHWTSWENLSRAKSDGGLGFRDFRALNEALLAKQGWRLLTNPQSFWAKIVKGLYFPNSSFLKAKKGSRASWAWSSLLHGRGLLVKGLRWQVQDGENVDFWEDKWIPSLPSFGLSSRKPTNCSITKVAEVLDSRKGGWNLDLLKSLVSHEELHAISSIQPSIVKRKDCLVWHHTSNGIYSVKSGYHLALQSHLSLQTQRSSCSFLPNKKMWPTIWKIEALKKIQNFWWRACRNSLATKENLFRRKCAQSKACPICSQSVESVEHLLFECDWA